ncbi:hypothetical protein [Haloarcula marina]|uniref:hypothetical protein n=1 Tax=Haloarcula marina TaxID=2961574 RepID=UPI0020B7705E|nr:hypothetical protein [Halomicroarcula marina]
MNRRRFLAGIGGGVSVLGGYAGVRLADIRPYDPASPTGETPRERIVAAARHRYAADHRAVTQVRITHDSNGAAGYDAATYREYHEHSRRRHTHVFTTRRRPAEHVPNPFHGLFGYFHWGTADRDRLPKTSVVHVTDGEIRSSWDAPTPEAGDAPNPPELGDDGISAPNSEPRSGMNGEFVLPHQTEWAERDDGGYEVTAPDGYAEVVTLPASVDGLRDGCRVLVRLDADGRLSRIVDDRVVTVESTDDNGTTARTVGYRIVTEFDQYGTATAPRPTGDVETTLQNRLASAGTDLSVY